MPPFLFYVTIIINERLGEMMNNKLVIAVLASAVLFGCQNTSSGTQESSTTTNSYSSMASSALFAAANAWGQQNQQSSTLADAIQQSTNVTSEQALGGVGSLLALAQNNLGESQNSELAGLIPGYDSLQSTGLTAMIANNETVKSAFTALGMDPSLISTFVPIILQTLQSQGASSSLLSSLGTIWQ
jgi:hypothetical protein